LAQDVGVVVEEHHVDDLDAMAALFHLRRDHLAVLVLKTYATFTMALLFTTGAALKP
jgi:hypothetical protein